MKNDSMNFNTILEAIYNLSIEDKMEIKYLLEHNIANARRDEILLNYKNSVLEEKKGELKFSSSISELKNLL
jgi:hypothetical protein